MTHLGTQDTVQRQPLGIPTDPNKKASWWWFIVQCKTEEEAIAWRPPQTPQLTYACWRPHAAPTTGHPHVHALFHYKTSQRFSAMQKIGQNCKFCTDDYQKINRRQYCISDVHKKDNTPKNPLAPFQEQGDWGIKQGERHDLIRAHGTILGKRKFEDVFMDLNLVQVASKYPRWCEAVYNCKPQVEIPEITDDQLRPWQKEVLQLLDLPIRARRIIWIWSHESDTGKSTFGKYLATKKDVIYHSKKQDLLYAFDNNEVIWFDLPREMQDDPNFSLKFMYNLIESLSNQQRHLVGKFHSRMKLIRAHIIVTSNEPPPLDKLPKRIIEFEITTTSHVMRNHME